VDFGGIYLGVSILVFFVNDDKFSCVWGDFLWLLSNTSFREYHCTCLQAKSYVQNDLLEVSAFWYIHCVSEKVTGIYFCDNLDIVQFCQFLVETYPREFDTNTYTAHDISILCVLSVPCRHSNDFYGTQHSIKIHVTLHFIAPDLCPPNILLTLIQLTAKSLTRQLISSVDGCMPVWELTLNICFDHMGSLFMYDC